MPGDQEARLGRPPAPARRRTALALGAVAFMVIAGLAAVFLIVGRSGAPTRIMLAVLPFHNLTGDPDQEYLCDGLTEEMIAQLGGLQPSRLAVIARTSAVQYKNTSKRADEIGRELGVDFLLESSVRRTGDRIRIAAQLIDVASQTHIWADVTALHFYSFYLASTGRSAEALPIAQRAISLDPLSLRAQVNLGVVLNMARRYDDAVSQFERTLDLDSGYAMTHAMLA